MNTTTHVNDQERKANGGVGEITLGLDLHATQTVVTAQLDASAPQPTQRIRTEEFAGWVRRLKERYPAARIYSCYEAGPCGYWLHRQLVQLGVQNYVVAPVALNGRRKTDKRDSRALREQLERYLRGHKKAFSVVKVPTEQQEQDRTLVRHREMLGKTLRRCAAQGRSLCLLQGLRVRGSWWGPRRWPELKESLPEWLREFLSDLQAQAQLAHRQLAAVTIKITALAKARAIAPPRGIGALTSLMLLLEVLDWHRFNNRREVASYTGCCAGEYTTGQRRREGAIDKQGNRRVRRLLVEAVWRLLIWQPDYPPLQRLRQAKGQRTRKRATVAAARRLAIDLWRLATGRTTPERVGLAAA
jgi:transposase